MHLLTFTLLTTCAFTGRLKLRPLPTLKYAVILSVVGIVAISGIRAMLSRSLISVESKHEIIARMQLIERPVESTVMRAASPNPDPLLPGQSLLERIRRRDAIRVGYNEDKLPFAYFNGSGHLVGFDVNMAHALARDLGVRIEFVPFETMRPGHRPGQKVGLVRGSAKRSVVRDVFADNPGPLFCVTSLENGLKRVIMLYRYAVDGNPPRRPA